MTSDGSQRLQVGVVADREEPAWQVQLPGGLYEFPSAEADLDRGTGRGRLSYRRATEEPTAATGWTLHQLRHSALTHLAEDGVDVALLKARSRHRSLRSQERYVRPSAASVANRPPTTTGCGDIADSRPVPSTEDPGVKRLQFAALKPAGSTFPGPMSGRTGEGQVAGTS